MITTYYYRQMSAPDTLRTYTDRRLMQELERLRLEDARVDVTFGTTAENHNVRCELVDGRGVHVSGAGEDADVFAAVDEAIERVTQQLANARMKQLPKTRGLTAPLAATTSDTETDDDAIDDEDEDYGELWRDDNDAWDVDRAARLSP